MPKFVRLRKSEEKQNHMELHEWCQPWVASATSVVERGSVLQVETLIMNFVKH